MIKLIASDMDGTLLDGNARVPEEFFTIFKKLKEKGVVFSAASGRQYPTLKENLHSIKDDVIYIAENGAFVVQDGEELFSEFIDRNLVKEMLIAARKLESVNILICGKQTAYIESKNGDYIAAVQRSYLSNKIVDDLMDVDDDIVKFTLCDFNGITESGYKHFYPLYKDKLRVVVSGEYWMDISNPNASKGNALKHIQEKLDVTPEQTLVFGDYFNDIEMLNRAHYSYAMANSPEEVKKHARFMAKSNKDHGVIHVLKELFDLK